MTGTATNTRQATGATRNAARAGELATGAAADSRDTAVAARTAPGAAVPASGAAVAVGVAAAAARIILEDNVSGRGARHRWSGRENIGRRHRRGGNRCSDGPGHYQWFHEV